MPHTPKLGQHFLINGDKLREIAGALHAHADDIVIEIGPGHGELTDAILAENQKLKIIALEKDPGLAANLKTKYAQDARVEIVQGDAREILSEVVQKLPANHPYKLAGNIPYYLTGYLLRTVSELARKPATIVLTIQKEVAERVAAKPPRMNLLSASIQIWATPEIIGIIPRVDFSPPPQVDSAILKLAPKRDLLTEKEAEKYYRTMRIVFKQPRKTALNNLAAGTGLTKEKAAEILYNAGIPRETRPEILKIEQIKKISDGLQENELS